MRNRKATVEPGYVLSFILRFSIILLAGIAASGSLMLIFLNRKVGPTYSEGISALSRLQTCLPYILFTTVLLQVLALSAIAMLLALLWSHRIAGPLVRFRRHLLEFATGRLPQEPVAFREGDQLQGLGQALSELVIAYKDKSVKALGLMVEAQKILDECEALKKQAKTDTQEFSIRLKRLEKIYLGIKDIYAPKA